MRGTRDAREGIEREREKGLLETERNNEHVNLSVSLLSLLHLINASVNRQTRCGEMALDGSVPPLEAVVKEREGAREEAERGGWFKLNDETNG